MSVPEPAACFSAGIKKIPNLEVFLGRNFLFRPPSDQAGIGAVLLWGHKSNRPNLLARRYAEERGLPLLRLEDGFLRSLDLGCRGAAPLSLIVDRGGIYYDSSGPSDLEELLNSSGWESPELLEKAERALKAVIASDLSKYNFSPPAPPGFLGDGSRPRIVIVDQTFGDMSVQLGQAGPADFQAMLDAARAEHSGADIFIKTHPDVIAGLKKGYFDPRADHGCTVIGHDYSPLSLLAQADEVYTVNSQMGFEALMLNKKVHCFGLPFYAGWGLTSDRKTCARRKTRRSLLELFAAAYILYPRYLNPFTGELTDIFDVIRILSVQRRHALSNRGAWSALGFSLWKHPQARAFLGTPGAEMRFFRKALPAADWAGKKGGRILAWSSKVGDSLGNVPLVRMEDGFFRSVGLGSDFQAPYSLVMDPDGIYYDPRRPSALEKILSEYDFQARPELLRRAEGIRQKIIDLNLSKYNRVGREDWSFNSPPGRRVILVPGQVEDDASIRFGAPEMKTNLELLRAVREANEDALIIYKPHPDVESGNRRGAVSRSEASSLADVVLQGVSLAALWGRIHEVHTLTSQVGFEALLRALPTYTYGLPFYAGWGLTRDRIKIDRRKRALTLDELVAGALILYPRYYDWGSGLFCEPEDVLVILAKGRTHCNGGRFRSFFFHLKCECYNMCQDIRSKLK